MTNDQKLFSDQRQTTNDKQQNDKRQTNQLEPKMNPRQTHSHTTQQRQSTRSKKRKNNDILLKINATSTKRIKYNSRGTVGTLSQQHDSTTDSTTDSTNSTTDCGVAGNPQVPMVDRLTNAYW